MNALYASTDVPGTVLSTHEDGVAVFVVTTPAGGGGPFKV